MAEMLPDREIKKLIGTIIEKGNDNCIKSSSYILRLGAGVRFFSTEERCEIKDDEYLEIDPGETVQVHALENINFREPVQDIYHGYQLAGLITPTTTMMREGFLFATTKIEPGYKGTLNWTIRNSSNKPIILKYGEEIFKLTILKLSKEETPEMLSGDNKESDIYHDKYGLVGSKRRQYVDVYPKKIIKSCADKRDPRKELKQAGYPFDYISTQLTDLHGRWEVVSKDVALLKEELRREVGIISKNIDGINPNIDKRFNNYETQIKDFIKLIFNEKLIIGIGGISAFLAICAAAYKYIVGQFSEPNQILIFIGLGASLILITTLLIYLIRK